MFLTQSIVFFGQRGSDSSICFTDKEVKFFIDEHFKLEYLEYNDSLFLIEDSIKTENIRNKDYIINDLKRIISNNQSFSEGCVSSVNDKIKLINSQEQLIRDLKVKKRNLITGITIESIIMLCVFAIIIL